VIHNFWAEKVYSELVSSTGTSRVQSVRALRLRGDFVRKSRSLVNSNLLFKRALPYLYTFGGKVNIDNHNTLTKFVQTVEL